MVSRYGQRNICLSIGNLQITLLCLMKIAGRSASYIGTQEVDGLDGHFSNGKLQYKIFAAGIGWATGLMLRKAPIFGSSTTRTLFPLFSYDNAIFISSCIVCKYCHIVFASHFLCPKWAAARQTGSKSKSVLVNVVLDVMVVEVLL